LASNGGSCRLRVADSDAQRPALQEEAGIDVSQVESSLIVS
jgi:hypothetical protein